MRWITLCVVLCLVIGGCRSDEHIGGPWVIQTLSTFAESGSGQPRLLCETEKGRVFLHDYVHIFRLYENAQCIVYEARHGQMFVAYAGRRPIKLDESEILGLFPDAWRMLPTGVVAMTPEHASKKGMYVFDASVICSAAKGEPEISRGWKNGPVRELKPRLIPSSQLPGRGQLGTGL